MGILLRYQRGPGLLEALFHLRVERIDHLVLFVKVVLLDTALWRLFGDRVQDQLELALGGGDGVLDRIEDMRRRELIHRNRQRRFGLAEERLEFTPAGFRTDADRHLHALLYEREIRFVRLLVAAGFGRQEIQHRVSLKQRFERRHHRPAGRAERDRGFLCDRHLFFHGGVDHRERDAELGLQFARHHRRGAGPDRYDDGRHRFSLRRILISRADRDDVLDVRQLCARRTDRFHDRLK